MSQTLPTTMAATLRASNKGLELVDKARIKKGWNKTEQAWADLATTSKATLRRFWGGVKIQTEAFQEICKAVGIEDWESISDNDHTQPKTYEKRLSFAIAGSIEKIDKQKLDAIVALLRKLGGDAEIEILDIEEGSIKLTLGGSEESLQRLQDLFESGELREVEGILVQNVQLLEKEENIQGVKGDRALRQSNRPNKLIRSILRSKVSFIRPSLKEIILRKINLNEADLSGANLNKTNLSR
ncbi:MAG: pentapeptide repeat-containing protein, partial [Symploca sp. SIO2G7]|nr:pentapeptide repeat-containing protein [Symploca sp. SIO2G7]